MTTLNKFFKIRFERGELEKSHEFQKEIKGGKAAKTLVFMHKKKRFELKVLCDARVFTFQFEIIDIT